MLTLDRNSNVSRIIVVGTLLGLAGCGSGSRLVDSGSFSGMVGRPSDRSAAPYPKTAGVANVNVTLSPTHLVGGASTEITIRLTEPAPTPGFELQLKSSNASVLAIPASVTIPSGQTSAIIAASTSRVSAETTVAITALYGETMAGARVVILPAGVSAIGPAIDSATKPAFTIAVKPSTLTIAPGKSGSAKVTTAVKAGYSHSLRLAASNVPAGVEVTFSPSTIAAPGNGTSKVHIRVPDSVAPGTYSMRVTANGGKTSQSTSFTLHVASSSSSGPGATFQGCWYQQNGNSYQGVTVSVTNPGTYAFDAVLYYGTTCDPSNWADEIGFGTPIYFGDWIFWFSAFANQADMSTLWYVGNQKSQCVSYTAAPDCE